MDKLQKLPKNAFVVAAQAIIEQLLYAKMHRNLKKSSNKNQLEDGTYEQFVSRLGKELDLNSLEAPDDLQTNLVTQHAVKPIPEEPEPTCHHFEKPVHYAAQCCYFRREEDQNEGNNKSDGNTINSNNSG